MSTRQLNDDPFNLIIAGVGGQGNVLASKLLGTVMVNKGFKVTVGETFGASQRGGSVASHLRVSADSAWSPQVPQGRAHAILALEPVEALRLLGVYGNPGTFLISNDRPIHPVGVICGDQGYPEAGQLKQWLEQYSRRAWLVPATDEALKLGGPIYGNSIMLGALAETGVLPFDRSDFEAVLAATMAADKVPQNLKAFDLGRELVRPFSQRS